MNIHRELAKYRAVCCRVHDQLLRLREVQQDKRDNGESNSWEEDLENEVYVALHYLEKNIKENICNAAFDDRDDKMEWASIETAPRDRIILVAFTENGETTVREAHWNQRHERFGTVDGSVLFVTAFAWRDFPVKPPLKG